MKSKSTLLLLLVIVFGLVLSSCDRQGNSPAEQAKGSEADVEFVPVETYRIRAGEIVETVSATGTVQPFRAVVVASETSGRITRVSFEVGDRVEAGALLVQLDDELKRLALDQAKAQRLQAEVTYEKAVKDMERHERLFAEGNITEYELEVTRLAEQVAEATYLSAEVSHKMARRQLADTRIISPIDGVVAERTVELGETVSAGAPIAKIVDIDRLRVRIGLPEEQIVRVHQGQEVTLSIDAYPGRTFHGQVFTVGPEASPDTRTFPVEVIVQNSSENPLRSGMVARVDVAVDVIRDVPLIPRDAILERSGKYIAFVVNGEKALKRTLDLGTQSAEMVEIRNGVAAGEDVVVVGQENLSDGTKVTVQKHRK